MIYKNTSVFPGSATYWENRYNKGGNSGKGSYDRLAEFKADVLNTFISSNNIKNVIEFGCGDGNQLSYFNFQSYIGLDISQSAIKLCIEKYHDDIGKSFYLYDTRIFQDNHKLFRADLAISLDVIFHLIEDDIYAKYMTHLFKAANKFVIIYSSNIDGTQSIHYKDRNFTNWIEQNLKGWELMQVIDNKYKYDSKNPENTSRSDFYIFKSTGSGLL
jgi:hypothetical protein